VKRPLRVVGILCVFLFLIGCARDRFVRDSYRVLSTMGTSYELAMEGLQEARKQGLLPEDDRQKALHYGGIFYEAYHPAVEGLKLLKRGQDPRTDVGALMVEASKGFGALMAVAGKYLQEVQE